MNPKPEKSCGKRSWLRWIGYSCGAFLLLYFVVYFVLSATGGWVVSESGETRLVMAVADSFVWQPRYGSCERFHSIDGTDTLRADGLGCFYAPLVLLDQRYVHRTIRFITKDFEFVQPLPAPPYAQYHPLRANRWQGRFPYEGGNAEERPAK